MRISLYAPLAMSLLSGCKPAPMLTDDEFDQLSRLVLDNASVPDDVTNAWSTDPEASSLGQRLFFDTRFSGPIVLESDLGVPGESGKISCASCHDPAEGGADHRSGGPTS